MVILCVEEHRSPWTPFRQDRKHTWIVPNDQIGLKLLQSMEIGGRIGVECAAANSLSMAPISCVIVARHTLVMPPLDDLRPDGGSTSHVEDMAVGLICPCGIEGVQTCTSWPAAESASAFFRILGLVLGCLVVTMAMRALMSFSFFSGASVESVFSIQNDGDDSAQKTHRVGIADVGLG